MPNKGAGNIDKRQHKRLEKPLTIQFCLDGIWDISIIKNISTGGIRFSTSDHLKLDGKIIQLRIRVPELSPGLLELEAEVLSSSPRPNSKIVDVRVKFINLSDPDKASLVILEKLINAAGNS